MINNIPHCIATVSNVDSLIEAVHRYADPVQVDSLVLTVINDENPGERILNTVSDSCYQAHAGAENILELCELKKFKQVEMPELDQILANADTLSSTEIWEKLKAKRGIVD